MELMESPLADQCQDRKVIATRAIDALALMARNYGATSIAAQIEEQRTHLQGGAFSLMVIGRFSAGKSTFWNAVLCASPELRTLDFGAGRGPLPVDTLPCTGVLQRVVYAESPYVRAQYFDGHLEEWNFERLWQEGRLDPDLPDALADIALIEIGLPAERLKQGLVIYDAPGLSEDMRRTAATREALPRMDAAVVLFRSDALMGEDELTLAQEVLDRAGHVFPVVNCRGTGPEDARLRQVAESRLAVLRQSPAGGRLDPLLALIDCEMAFQAGRSGSVETLRRSGMQAFEQRLDLFLREGVEQAQILGVLARLQQFAPLLETHLRDRQRVLVADQDAVHQALQMCERQFTEMEARRLRIGALLERTGRRAGAVASDSLRVLLSELPERIEARFAEAPLPLLQSWTGQLRSLVSNAAAREAARTVHRLLEDELRHWSEVAPPAPGLQQDLWREIEDGRAALQAEYEGLEAQLRTIDLHLGALQLEVPAVTPLISLKDRLVGAGLGAVLMGPLGLTHVLGGWRSTAGSLMGVLGTKVALTILAGTLGIVLGPAALTATFIAAMLGGGAAGGMFRIEERVRRQAMAQVGATIGRLREDPNTLEPLRTAVVAQIAADSEQVLTALDRVLQAERERIVGLQAVHQRRLAGQDGQIGDIGIDLSRIRSASAELRAIDERGVC